MRQAELRFLDMEIDFKDVNDKSSEAYRLKMNRQQMKEKQRFNQEQYDKHKIIMHE